MTNTAIHTGYVNDSNHDSGAILSVNDAPVLLARECIGRTGANYDKPVMVWVCYLSNDWNQSATQRFEARTLKQLVRKIEKHPYRLVK